MRTTATGPRRPFLKLPSPESNPAGMPPRGEGAPGTSSSSGGHLARSTTGNGGRWGAGDIFGKFESSMDPPARSGAIERARPEALGQFSRAANLTQAEKRGESSGRRSNQDGSNFTGNFS